MKRINLLPIILSLSIPSSFSALSCSNLKIDTFEYDTWDEVCRYADQGLDKLKEHYNKTTFVGLTRTIILNGLRHRVRVIGENHDTITGTGNKAALTFELIDLVSAKHTNGLCCQLDKISNCDYPHSNIYNVLCGEGDVEWYTSYPLKIVSTKYKKSCLSMIKDENLTLYNSLKTVTKTYTYGEHNEVTGETVYSLKQFNTKLFTLSYTELAQSGDERASVEDTPYSYWIQHNNKPDRILRHLNGVPRSTWLRTPNVKFWTRGWYQHRTGILDVNYSDGGVRNLGGCAFAFCI